jgi:hypothetical protein
MNFSGRFSFVGKDLRAIVIFFILFLGYHCYHRELGRKSFPFIPNLIMAGSWGGYLIAFTAGRVDIQATWFFYLA